MDSYSRQQFSQGHTSRFDDIGKTVAVQPLNLANSARDEVYATVNRIVHPNHALRDIDEAHWRSLIQSFCNYTLYYTRGLLVVYFWAAVNPAANVMNCRVVHRTSGATYATAVYHVDEKKVLKYDCCMFMLDGLRRRHSVELVRDEDHLAWAPELLCIRYVFHIEWKLITPHHATKLIRIANISTVNARREAIFTDVI